MQPNPYNQPPISNPGGPPYQPTPSGVTSSTTLIVTGILGILCCGLLAPYTWIKSNQALQILKSGYGNVAEISTYNTTRIIGIIGTVLWILGVLLQILIFGFALIGGSRTTTTTTPPSSIPIPPSP